MTMKKTTPPLDYTRAHISGLSDFVDPTTSLGSLMLHNNEAFPVCTLVLAKVGAASNAQAIEPLSQSAGWRFVAGDSFQSGASHVGSAQRGLAPQVTGFSNEPEVGDAIDALRELEAMPFVWTADFELRILRVPWLRLETFWLHTVNGQGDVIVPYAGFPNAVNLQLMTPYAAPDFLQAIQPTTQQLYTEWVQQRVSSYQKDGELAKAQAVRHRAAEHACLAEANRMDACARVLSNVNDASAEEIHLALDLEDAKQAEVIIAARPEGGWQHLNDLLKGLAKQSRIRDIVQKRSDRIGFGYKLQRAHAS